MKSIVFDSSASLHISAILVLLISINPISAQDISTIAEIYDYEVNDVFHTEEYASTVGMAFMEYRNILITDKFYSPDEDTVFYVRSIHEYMAGSDNPDGSTDFYQDTIFYTDLNALIHNGYIDSVYTSSAYNGRKINYDYSSNIPDWREDIFIEGCGGSYYDFTDYIDDIHINHHLKLIYFKKGTEEWGTPHYITAVETMTSKSDLRVYPNPASDNIRINLPDANHKVFSGMIFSSTGQRIQKFNFSSVETKHLDVSTLKRGIYMIRLITDDTSYSSTFIKN